MTPLYGQGNEINEKKKVKKRKNERREIEIRKKVKMRWIKNECECVTVVV